MFQIFKLFEQARKLIIDKKFRDLNELLDRNGQDAVSLLLEFSKLNDTEVIKILITDYFIDDYKPLTYTHLSYVNIFKCYLEVKFEEVQYDIDNILHDVHDNSELLYEIYKLANEANIELEHYVYFEAYASKNIKLAKYIIKANPLINLNALLKFDNYKFHHLELLKLVIKIYEN